MTRLFQMFVLVGLALMAGPLGAAAGSGRYGLLPGDPQAPARVQRIDDFRKRAPALATRFSSHVWTGGDGESMPYRLYSPDQVQAGRRYPLVVFLHGAGGSGTDNERQLQGANIFGALVWALPENQARHPCYILAPQSDVNWPCVIIPTGVQPRTPRDIRFCPWPALGAGVRRAFAVIDDLAARLPIDDRRIYVTGHSMGGAGAWHMIAHRPRFFAAAVPVCGHPDPVTASIARRVPVWNFHGETDEVEPVATSRVMIDALRAAGGKPRHTEYPGVGHNVFRWVYTEPALPAWLFDRRR